MKDVAGLYTEDNSCISINYSRSRILKKVKMISLLEFNLN